MRLYTSSLKYNCILVKNAIVHCLFWLLATHRMRRQIDNARLRINVMSIAVSPKRHNLFLVQTSTKHVRQFGKPAL